MAEWAPHEVPRVYDDKKQRWVAVQQHHDGARGKQRYPGLLTASRRKNRAMERTRRRSQ